MKEKNNQKGLIQTPLLIAIIIGIVGISGFYFGLNQYQNYQTQKDKNAEITRQDQEKKNIEQQVRDSEIEKLRKEVESLKNQKPEAIIKEVAPEKSDLSSVIKYWKPRVALIHCKWFDNSESWGSGMLNKDPVYGMTILTNEHMVSNEDGISANRCEFSFPNNPQVVYPFNSILNVRYYADKKDRVFITIDNPDSYINNITSSDFKVCFLDPDNSKRGSVGDEIVILGYPGIGSQTDVTATRGIISGFDGDYYITDAKVEHGNSGGVAILAKNNCYLGIPTYAISGSVESLARILDAKNIFQH